VSGLRGYTATINTGQFGDTSELLPILLSQVSDQLANQLIPNLKDFAQAGENGAQTLARLIATTEQLRGQQAQARTSLIDMVRALPDRLGITGLLDFRSSLQVSDTLSPTARLANARSLYERTLHGAQAGNLGDVQALPQFAQQLLSIGRDNYASGPQFAALYREIMRETNQVIHQQRDVEHDLLRDIPRTILHASHDQLLELRRIKVELSNTVQVLRDTRLELRRIAPRPAP